MSKDVFLFICITNKNEQHVNPRLGVVQNHYICDTKTGIIR